MRIVPWEAASGTADARVLPVAVISLADQQARRRLMIERGVPQDWVNAYWPATDLRTASPTQLEPFVDVSAYPLFSGEPLRAAVVGCATSHRRLAQWLAATHLPLLLVLEDDVVPCVPDPGRAVLEVAQLLWSVAESGEAFVCHLGTRPEQVEQSLRRPLASGNALQLGFRLWWHIDPRPTVWRAHAYLLSRAAAQRIVAREPRMLSVADDWVRRRDLGLLDRLFLVEPRIFSQDEQLSSTLGIPPNPLATRPPSSLPTRLAASLRFRSRMLSANVLNQQPFQLKRCRP